MNQSNFEDTDVVISKGQGPKECALNGLQKLGGISKFIKEGDQVFIKFNLTLPQGFPSHTNINTIEAVIESCTEAGAKKIYLGSFPSKGITVNAISNSLGLKKYFLQLGAELVFLDNSNYYHQKNFNAKDLKIIKYRNFTKLQINEREVLYPKIILESDKYISINQVNVDPIFKLRLSILNSFTSTTNNYYNNIIQTENLKDLIAFILDVYSIKKPDLVINDIFYILERSGPFIYRDSNLKKTNLMVMGTDAIAVDSITLKLMDKRSVLHEEALNRNLGVYDAAKINIIGETIDHKKIDIQECVSDLEEINLPNLSVKAGRMSIGEFEQAYHFLNFLKTYMLKDVKYISKFSFVIGKNPPEPEPGDTLLLFGDNAIGDISLQRGIKALKFAGNPPNFLDCIGLLTKFFKKGKLPLTYFYYNADKFLMQLNMKKGLKMWEGL